MIKIESDQGDKTRMNQNRTWAVFVTTPAPRINAGMQFHHLVYFYLAEINKHPGIFIYVQRNMD
jgi:hypothetical protein